MAEISEIIGKALRKQALPAAQKLRVFATEGLEMLRDKAEEVAREFNKPSFPSRLP